MNTTTKVFIENYQHLMAEKKMFNYCTIDNLSIYIYSRIDKFSAGTPLGGMVAETSWLITPTASQST